MHDGMQYGPIQGQGHEPFKVGNPAIFKSCLRHLQWKLASDHRFLNWDTMSTFVWARFLKFVLVFVSRDFELGTVRPSVCTSVGRSPKFSLILMKFGF